MSFLGVSISCVTPNLPNASASGIKICDHFILTHCSIVWHIVKETVRKNLNIIFVEKNLKSIQWILSQRILHCNSKFSVVLPPEQDTLNSKCVLEDCVEDSDNISDVQWEKAPASCINCSIEQVIISPCLIFEFLSLLYRSDKWKFDKSEENESHSNKYLENVYLSTFLILRTKVGGDINCCFGQFEELTSSLKKGTTVFIDGCPFGYESARSVFLNSLTKGIISNVSHDGNIILTDARCIIGCEGAPSYSLEHRFRVCGIVLSPFCWLKGEWIGLTFMAAIQPLLAYIRNTVEPSNTVEMYPVGGCSPDQNLVSSDGASFQVDDETLSCNPSSVIMEARLMPDMVSVMNKCIVRIIQKGNDEWGTGVAVRSTKGLVITCAHVTRGAANKAVDVVFWDGTKQEGTVIFETRNHPEETAPSSRQTYDFNVWDLAVVRLPFQPLHALPLSKELPEIGTEDEEAVNWKLVSINKDHWLTAASFTIKVTQAHVHISFLSNIESGTTVIIGGHPLFTVEALATPTFSLGNLANVSKVFRKSRRRMEQTSSLEPQPSRPLESAHSILVNRKRDAPPFHSPCMGLVGSHWRRYSFSDDVIPVVLQTTCAVYNGVSGGPVVALHPGKGAVIIGIASCCARDVESKVCFPHVNLATPVFLLADAVEAFNFTEDLAVFEPLIFNASPAISVLKSKI